MVHYAELAEQNGVDLLSVGTELSSITGSAYTTYWNSLIDEVREVYSGKLTYAANWGEEKQVGFWGKLDYVGVDFYAPLTEHADPTRAELLAALNTAPAHDFTADLYDGKAPLRFYADLAAQLEKPLLFTEVGWNSVNGGNMQWSNTVQNPGLDPQEQADLYAAFLEALGKAENQFVDGVFFWAWGPQVDPNNPYSMSIEHNPARTIVQDAFEDWSGLTPPTPMIFAEYGGRTGVNQTPVTVMLEHKFVDPVVIVSTTTYNGSDPVNVRITSIQQDRFTIRVQEPEHLDDKHTRENVSWMVVERGNWLLENGAHVQAGTHDTAATTAKPWAWVDLEQGFRGTPVVLSQVQTNNDPTWVVTRERNVDPSHFEFVMEREEKLASSPRGPETLGYVAIDPSSGTVGGNPYWAYSLFDVTGKWTHLDFGPRFGAVPNILGSISTTNDIDTVTLRMAKASRTGVDFMTQEDSSKDLEATHGRESVDFFAVPGQGLLTGYEWDVTA
jgi:hypothetical protein